MPKKKRNKTPAEPIEEQSKKPTSESKPQSNKPMTESIQETTPNKKKTTSKRKWYWIVIVILVIILAAVIAFGIVDNQKSANENRSSNQVRTTSTTVPTTTEMQMAKAGSGALSKADFSFGGRTVNGYQNFIDLCEKEGGSHSYYFSDAGTYCKNANRGVDIGDDVLDDHNSVKDAFGEPDVESEIEDEAMPDWSNDPQCRGFHYIYSFSYHGHTYKKIIFVVVGAAWAGVSGIEYVVE